MWFRPMCFELVEFAQAKRVPRSPSLSSSSRDHKRQSSFRLATTHSKGVGHHRLRW